MTRGQRTPKAPPHVACICTLGTGLVTYTYMADMTEGCAAPAPSHYLHALAHSVLPAWCLSQPPASVMSIYMGWHASTTHRSVCTICGAAHTAIVGPDPAPLP
jgi:hypothetical protein